MKVLDFIAHSFHESLKRTEEGNSRTEETF